MDLGQLAAIIKAVDSDHWASQLTIALTDEGMEPDEIADELRITRLSHLWELDPGFESNVYRCEQSCFEYIAEFEDDVLTIMQDDLEVEFNVDGSTQ